MSNLTHFVGVDVGTGGCRVSIYDERGALAASAASEYALYTPKPGWAEQDPEDIFQAFRRALSQSLAALPRGTTIRALAFASTLHGIFPVSRDGLPLHRALIWADVRAESYLDEIRSKLDVEALYERTACPLHAMYPLAKLVWFRRERPAEFSSAFRFVSIKEFLIFRLTGRFAVDRSTASGTGLFDVHKLEWDAACLDLLSLDRERLSPIFSTTHVFDTWSAADFGLQDTTALVLGAGDGVLSTLGAGAVGPNQYTLMIGTSGAVRRCVPEPVTNRSVRNWCYNLTDRLWVAGGAINNGGLALKWVKDNLAPGSYEELDAAAASVPAGADGLIFLPFFSGERSPHWNSHARGVLFGLTLNHTRSHVVRAVMEGVAYSLYSVFIRLRQLSAESATSLDLRASGSATRSRVWLQIIADVFGERVTRPGDPEGTAFGAAVLGMIATGRLSGPGAVETLMGPAAAIHEPDAANHLQYQRLFGIYEEVYRNLVGSFDALARVMGGSDR